MKTLKLIMVLLLIMTLSNCNNDSNKNQSQTDNKSKEISVQLLKSEFDAGKEMFLLDVRTVPEFNEARLSFADDLIPYDSIQLYVDKLPQDKATTIYLFCRSGRRSGIVTEYLRSLGYSNAFNVTGGIIAWQNSGYEIASGAQ